MISAMAQIDPEQERQRLVEFYSSKTDGELEQVAGQSGELTDVAREVLRDELARRRISPQQLEQSDAASQDELDFRDLVVIRSFWGLLDAELARGALEAAGIEAFLFDDNMVRMDWFNANALGGVKLRVDAHNVEAANRVLQEAADQEISEVDPDEPELPA